LVPLLAALISCGTIENNTEIEEETIDQINESDYPIEKLIIWADALTKEGEYFAYIFSRKCFYCNQIKEAVITFSELCQIGFYFIEFTDGIPIANETDLTIGKKEISEIFIKGVPSLMKVKNGEVVANYAGAKEILDIITNS